MKRLMWEKRIGIVREALFDKENNYVGTTEAPGGHCVYPYDNLYS